MSENTLSVVVPIYNEAGGLASFNGHLIRSVERAVNKNYEVIYVNDGSTDATEQAVKNLCKDNEKIKLVSLSRNFGKENALTAGIANSSGKAVLTIDGDGQHPAEQIPHFVEKWQAGAKVVVGIRSNRSGGYIKSLFSRAFYGIYNRISQENITANATDFRLIDAQVRDEFLKLTESNRLTRGLIDWLGFKRDFIKFNANKRISGTASYSKKGLVKLAAHSFVSMSAVPLYIFGYLGIFITGFSLLLGASVFTEQVLLNDPWNWNFTGTAMIGILLLFLVGILLMSQGMLSLYISHIHAQTKKRPLYVIDYEESVGVKKD